MVRYCELKLRACLKATSKFTYVLAVVEDEVDVAEAGLVVVVKPLTTAMSLLSAICSGCSL